MLPEGKKNCESAGQKSMEFITENLHQVLRYKLLIILCSAGYKIVQGTNRYTIFYRDLRAARYLHVFFIPDF